MESKWKQLYEKIEKRQKSLKNDARFHKRLNRSLWMTTSFLSIVVALSANIEFEIGGISSGVTTAFFSIILPVVTGYTVLRNPESLWIFEVDIRNRLTDMLERIDLLSDSENQDEYEKIKAQYFDLMAEANSRWQSIRQGNTSKFIA